MTQSSTRGGKLWTGCVLFGRSDPGKLTLGVGFVWSAPFIKDTLPAFIAGWDSAMAKPASIKIKLNSSADTGFYYVTKKNARTMTEKMVVKKYDPVVRKHVEFREGKIK